MEKREFRSGHRWWPKGPGGRLPCPSWHRSQTQAWHRNGQAPSPPRDPGAQRESSIAVSTQTGTLLKPRTFSRAGKGPRCDGVDFLASPESGKLGDYLPFGERRKVAFLLPEYWMVTNAYPPAPGKCRLSFRRELAPLLRRWAQLPSRAVTTGAGKPSW